MNPGVIRNKVTAHGQEDKKAKENKKLVDDDFTKFVLSQTASIITLSISNYKKTL